MAAAAAEADDRNRAKRLIEASAATWDRLDRFVELLVRWNQTTNLVSSATIGQLWTRHVADSLQLLDVATAATGTVPLVWIDLGSGAGFPGLPIACALADQPGAKVMLVESNRKKAAFLREAGRVTGAPVEVFDQRIEQFVDDGHHAAAVVTARALAPMKTLLDQSVSLLTTGTIGVFPKGQDVEAELTEAAKYWTINYHLVPSRTDPRGRIVVVRGVRHRTGG